MMFTGIVLYRKSNGNEIVYSGTREDEMMGYVRTKQGITFAEQTIGSILARGYWQVVEAVETELRPNGGYDTRGIERLQKHGSHDQSSHNPHKGGRGGSGSGSPTRTFEAGQDEEIHAALKEEQGAYIETLSEKQLKSVAGYQAEGTYDEVNGFLRGEKGPISPEDQELIKTFDGVVAGASLQYNTTVYRGVSDTDGQFRELKVGDAILEKGFSSTSPNPAVAEAFANSTVIQGQPVVLEIDVPFGQPALASDVASSKLFGYDIIQDDPMMIEITGFTRLNEITLPRGLNMEVVKVTDKENARYVKVKITK